MLVHFYQTLRQFQVPTSIRELLDLNAALKAGVVFADQEQFYQLARICLVKDERHLDKFDRAFKAFFDGLEGVSLETLNKQIPEDWLRKELEKHLSPEELAELQKAGSLEELLKQIDRCAPGRIGHHAGQQHHQVVRIQARQHVLHAQLHQSQRFGRDGFGGHHQHGRIQHGARQPRPGAAGAARATRRGRPACPRRRME